MCQHAVHGFYFKTYSQNIFLGLLEKVINREIFHLLTTLHTQKMATAGSRGTLFHAWKRFKRSFLWECGHIFNFFGYTFEISDYRMNPSNISNISPFLEIFSCFTIYEDKRSHLSQLSEEILSFAEFVSSIICHIRRCGMRFGNYIDPVSSIIFT